MFKPLLIGGAICAALSAPLLQAEPAGTPLSQPEPAGEVPGWSPPPDSGATVPAWVERRRAELMDLAPRAPTPPKPPKAPDMPSATAGMPDRGSTPDWVIEQRSQTAVPSSIRPGC